MFAVRRLPGAFAVLIVLLWAFGDGEYGAIHSVLFVVTAPASLLASAVADRVDADFTAYTLGHLLWAAFAYLQWRLIVRAPAWLRDHAYARGVLAIVAIMLTIGGVVGILTGIDAAKDSEHSLFWHVYTALWITGFGVALGVLVLLGRPAMQRTLTRR